jgi:hypothetical protein
MNQTITIRRIDVRSALKFGVFFSPILYTSLTFLYTLGSGVSLGMYVSGFMQAIIYGGLGTAITAFVYNAVAGRFGALKLQIEVTHESQKGT